MSDIHTGDSGAVPDSVPSGGSVTLIERLRDKASRRGGGEQGATDPIAILLYQAAARLAVLELRESDRQSSGESEAHEDWLDAENRCSRLVEALSHYVREDFPWETGGQIVTWVSRTDWEFHRSVLASATKPEASPSPESESENV